MKGSKFIAIIIVSLLMFGGVAFSQFSGSLWYPDDTSIFPVESSWHLGSSSTRIEKAWLTDLDVSGVFNLGGTFGTSDITIKKADPSILFDVTTATDTDFWIGVQDDADGVDDDKFHIGKGLTPGSNILLTI